GHAVPTTENLCRAIDHLLEKQFLGAQLDRVRLEETSRNAFEFAGNREGQP
ncbi:MAG: 6-carboxytetrahydropterin synthase, partial [Acidobacteria bacterium]|nr:6-carboxytetrahydropterin synthase [Acidobacteriota bacterium]